MAGKQEFRLAHTMIRVRDLEKSMAFYTGPLGMTVLSNTDYPDGKFTNVFVGYGDENSSAVVELTHNWDQAEPYDLGTGWGHLAIEMGDIYAACEEMATMGATVSRPPGPMMHGTTHIAFVEDPDGYKIELIQTGTGSR